MDPKTLVFIGLLLLFFGSTVTGFLQIAGLTKTTVISGGKVTVIVLILSTLASVVGTAFLLLLVMFQGDIFIRTYEHIFGG